MAMPFHPLGHLRAGQTADEGDRAHHNVAAHATCELIDRARRAWGHLRAGHNADERARVLQRPVLAHATCELTDRARPPWGECRSAMQDLHWRAFGTKATKEDPNLLESLNKPTHPFDGRGFPPWRSGGPDLDSGGSGREPTVGRDFSVRRSASGFMPPIRRPRPSRRGACRAVSPRRWRRTASCPHRGQSTPSR